MDDLLHKRNHALDITRIIAVLAVVMIHCSGIFVENYKPQMNEFVFGNLFNSIARVGVPLFLMVSGSLFLDENKEITLKNIISKNVKSIAIVTIVWAFIYAIIHNVFFPLLTGGNISIKDTFVNIMNGHYHMWYLYMIIGIYIITPILKKIVCKENKEIILFLIIVLFVVQFLLPTIEKTCIQWLDISFIMTWIDKFHLAFFDGYITYYLVGWYIVHVGIKQKHLKFIYFIGLLSLMFIVFYVQFTGNYKNAYENIGVPVFVYSISIFIALNNIKFNLKEKTMKIIGSLSKLTFGVYIVHALVLDLFKNLFPYNKYCILYIFVCFVTVSFVSFTCAYVISKISLIKKLIKM